MMIQSLSSVLFLCSVSSIASFSTKTPTTIATRQHYPVRGRSTTLSALDRSSDNDNTLQENSSQRRFLLSFALTTATLPLDYLGLKQYRKTQELQRSSLPPSLASSTDNSFLPVSNLDEALKCIETSVDPRFLHAVVASDYQCFYQQGSRLGLASRFLETPTGSSSSSSSLFDELERNQLKDRPVQPGQSQLLVSNIEAARKKWGGNKDKNIVSVWPLMGEERTNISDSSSSTAVHYAWPENGGVFLADSNIIVDGIDCGRMSLEDALEGDMEVLIQAKQFLVIPLAMEEKLVQKLRGAFLM